MAAPATSGVGASYARTFPQIEPGETTEAELIQMLGEPHIERVRPDGQTVLTWQRERPRPLGVLYAAPPPTTLNVSLQDGRVVNFAWTRAASGLAPRGFAPASDDELWIIARRPQRTLLPAAPVPGAGALFAASEIRVNGPAAPLEPRFALPLRRMAVKAFVHGYLATVELQQQFDNPHTAPIEVQYFLPLPQTAAVTEFLMTIGARRIRGIVRERQDAEQLYAEARRQGFRASLFTEDAPNLFTQSVANVAPGTSIGVRVQYSQPLAYADGWLEFGFPLAARAGIRPPEVTLSVDVDAGVPIEDFECNTHPVTHRSPAPERLIVSLDPTPADSGHAVASPPSDRDFLLRYRVAGDRIKSALLTQRDEHGVYFTLLLYPPQHRETRARLTDLQIHWGQRASTEVFPRLLPDLVADQPVILTGRFLGKTDEPIRVSAKAAGELVQWEVPWPADDRLTSPNALPALWARMKIADLTRQLAHQPLADETTSLLARQIKQLALDYGLPSPFTAFVAVDATERTSEAEAIPAPDAASARPRPTPYHPQDQ
jgi:hypothetical protein